mmetsp:Transcript_35076/g.98512  ORF Transcript_35076/g.98512 Transcript_35076/m.98512 type:complete len:441 (+) Transcript_35076:148-1470(+)
MSSSGSSTSIGSPSSSISFRGKPSMSHSIASPSMSSAADGLPPPLPPAALPTAARACSFSCQWSSLATRRSMSHSRRASSSVTSFEASRCDVEDRRPLVRHTFSSCEKCCRRQSASLGSSHAGSRDVSPLAASARRRRTPTTSAASRPRTYCGAKRPQSSHTWRMRTTCSRALSAWSRLSTRCRLTCRCSKMSGRDFSNSRLYAQAAGRELLLLWRMSLTIMSLANFSDISVSTIVNASVMHSATSMAQSLLSRQNAMASRTELRELVMPRSSCSSLSQSASLSRLPPAMPFLSRSRFWRSCVARSSKRWRSRSSSMSACVQVEGIRAPVAAAAAVPPTPPPPPLPPPCAAACCASCIPGRLWCLGPPPPAAACCAGGAREEEAFLAGGPEEKLVLRLLPGSSDSQGGGHHHAPPSHSWKLCVRHCLKLSPCAKAYVLQR